MFKLRRVDGSSGQLLPVVREGVGNGAWGEFAAVAEMGIDVDLPVEAVLLVETVRS